MYRKRKRLLPLILTLALILSAFPATALADSVVDLTGSLYITEGDPAVLVDTSATVASGDYANGYVQMSTSTASQYDQLSFQSAANPNAEGAISFSGSTVYLGDGSGTLAIGNIDSTYNGQNGQPLRVNFVTPMANSGFENGSTGWSLNNSNYYISGDTIGSTGTYTTSIEQEYDGNHYLHLSIRGTTNSYGTGHGPTATSSYFEASPGDIITFDWKAARTSDYYDVYAYLINDATGQKFQILYQRGSSISSWQNKQITLTSAYLNEYSDKLKFMFVCGSYDQTGGRAVGSTMDIDNARVVKSFATPEICRNILRQVKYQNTSDDPVASLDLVAQLKDKYGSVYSDSKPCYITPVNDAPSLVTNSQFTLNEGTMASISNSYLRTTDVDDTAAELTYTVTGLPSNGTLTAGGSPLSTNGTFTQSQLDSGQLVYNHNGTKTTSDSFAFSVADGCEDGVSPITGTFSIDVNSLPTVDTNEQLVLNEGSLAAINTSLLSSSDIDNSSSQLTYTITAAPSGGTLYKSGSAMGVGSTITQAELESGALSYVHSGGESPTDSFSFRLSDPASHLDSSFSISVNPINDPPSIAANSTLTLLEGTETTITSSQLNEGDPDDSGSALTYTVTSDVSHGTLYKSGQQLSSQSTFTQQDVNDGIITYMHDGTQTTSDSFGFSLSDGGEDGAEPYSGTFSISITPVNDKTTTYDQTYDVDENSENGTQIGTVVTYDEEGDTRTFAITGGNDSGLFAINSETGMITVAGAIDYDAVQQYKLTVTVTEHYEGTTRTVPMTATINVNNMHDIPFTPTAADLDPANDSGRSDTDDITKYTTPMIFGEDGSTMFNNTVNVYVDGELDGTAQANADGAWSYTLSGALSDGQHVITLTTTDFGGDTSAQSEPFTVTIDTTAPDAGSMLGLPLGGDTTDDRTPTMSADGEADCLVTVYDDTAKNYGTVMTDSNGDFEFTVSNSDSLSVGTHRFAYTLTDAAGNISAPSELFSLTVNDPPAAQDTEVTTLEDIAYIFDVEDFNYGDANSDDFEMLRITVLATDGTLKLSDGSGWTAITLGQEISVDDIDAGMFAFFPDADENGAPYATFKFKVSDGIDYCTDVYTATVNVTPVNDVQLFTGLDGTVVDYLEDQGTALLDENKASSVTDIDNTQLGGGTLRVSITENGAASEDMLAVTADANVTLSDGSNVGSTITVDEQVIGTITAGGLGQDLVISLTVFAELDRIEKLIYAVTYENMNTVEPAVESRTVTFTLTDIDGQSAAQSITVNVERTEIPVIETLAASRHDIDADDATCSGEVLSDGKAEITEVGIVYSLRRSFVPSDTEKMVVGEYTSEAQFEAFIKGLPADTMVYYAAYALNSEGYGYGEVMTLRTHKWSDRNGDGILDNPDADTDGDGVSDGDERAAGSDPDAKASTPSDTDGDGKVDSPRADTDGDGVSDADEQAAGSNPDDASSTPSDIDGDGKVDKPSADTDGDGVSDADEQAAGSDPDDASSTPSDKDGDGKADKPSADTDGDGVSDADEIAAGSNPDDASSTPSDKDGDGKIDKPDADSDGDGVSDADEIAAGSDPDDPYSTPSDKDGDGKVDDPDADSDGDGISDADEIAAGSDPDDPMSKPVAEGQAAVLQRPPVDAPAKPASGSASAFSAWQSKQGTTETAVALGWDSVSGADYYLIWNGSTLLGTVYGAQSCLVSGLEAGTVYELRIGAFTMGGERVAASDKIVGVADIAAATYGEDGLPLEEILSEYFGGSLTQVGGSRYDLTGQITDENGVPLPGLTVELHSTPRTTVTDENGWYYFDNVEKGEHTIYVYYNSNESNVALKLFDQNGTALAADTKVITFDTSASRTSTFILNMSVNEQGEVTVERIETYPAVFSTDGGGSSLGYIWWIFGSAAAGLFIFFFILFKRRRKQDEQEFAAA